MAKLLIPFAFVAAIGLGGFGLWRAYAPGQAKTAEPETASLVIPELEGDAVIGLRAYTSKCASCHGENGVGVEGAGPPFLHPFYKPSHHGDAAFFVAAESGVRAHHWKFGNMPPVAGVTKAEVAAIVAYVRSLQAANGVF
jgi:mono/diheme cytochrome c family protein